MITIEVPEREVYYKETFYKVEKRTVIQLEHSLISIQKWESKWHKAFLSRNNKTTEETIDYIRCMCITPNVKEDVFYCIPPDEMKRILQYLEDPMTATHFREDQAKQDLSMRGNRKEVITAELVYYWMVTLNIPSEYKKWHINQLLTLIRLINLKNAALNGKGKNKRSRMEILEDHRSINEENKKRFGTSG